MVTHSMKSELALAKASDFYDFMTNLPSEVYAHWLREEHYEARVIKEGKNKPLGNLIYFDQNIGKKYRMKFHAIIRTANRPAKIVYQMRKFGISLPGYLELEFADTPNGLLLKEHIRIGFNGLGKVLDPFIRIVYNKHFFKEMDAHHKREWECLAEILKK